MTAALSLWLARSEWRAYPVRTALSICAIAAGVALGFGVHLINDAALGEIGQAVATVSGRADASVIAATPTGFPEGVYARVARAPEIENASPVVDASVSINGLKEPVRVLGIDPFQAALVTPALVAVPAAGRDPLELLSDDGIFLSPALLRALTPGPRSDSALTVLSQGAARSVRIAGTLPFVPPDTKLVVMDIAAAQWRLGYLGRLSRIDVKFKPGQAAAGRARLVTLIPTDARLETPAEAEGRADALSRAYRINLDMLALMALFTGGFLVYSLQTLSVTRRAGQFALLGVLGLPAPDVVRVVLVEAVVLGVVGTLLGLGLGAGIAAAALAVFGGDLGGGYFLGTHPHLGFSSGPALTFAALGLAAALVGSFLPARRLTTRAAVEALKSSEAPDPRTGPRSWPALALGTAALLALFVPPTRGISWGGYAAIGLGLCAGVAAMPWLARLLFRPVAGGTRLPLPLHLALLRLAGAPRQAAVALAGMVAATALFVAMGIMVTSFRDSVDQWVARLLPAELYLHDDAPLNSVAFDPVTQGALEHVPGVVSIDFGRNLPLQLAAARPPLTLIVRTMPPGGPGAVLMLVEEAQPTPRGPLVWVSEAARDLYGLKPGQSLRLPLVGADGRPHPLDVAIAGVWRDYARQTGSIVIGRADYQAATGDADASDAGVHLAHGADIERVEAELRRALPPVLAAHVQFARPQQIRTLSLSIFDRSFAVTYVLEAVAIAIGLVGVASTFSAQTVARAREFGMLRHLGVQRREILWMLASEGALLGLLGVVSGLALGIALSQILIRVVNPQSFHWTMDTHFPWALLAGAAASFFAAAALTAVLAGRHAVGRAPILAVREDW